MAPARSPKKATSVASTPSKAKSNSFRSPILTRSRKIDSSKLAKKPKESKKEVEEELINSASPAEEEQEEQEEQENNEGIALPSDSDDSAEEEEDDEIIKGFEEEDKESEEEEDSEKSNKKQKKTQKESIATKSGFHSVVKPKGTDNDKFDKNSNNKSSNRKNSKKGVIYIGRIPHGFHEAEMKKYFEQFGEITRLRLSRNKKTGSSKHYGFIEFNDFETAKVAAETMNNYLIFGHLLKVEIVAQENQHDELFNGSNTKFKSIPWSKISQYRNDKPKTSEKWDKIVKKTKSNNAKKQAALKSKGINYDISALLKK